MTLTAFAAATLAAAAFTTPAAPAVAPARPDDRPGVVYWTAHRLHINHVNRMLQADRLWEDPFTQAERAAEVRASTWRAR